MESRPSTAPEPRTPSKSISFKTQTAVTATINDTANALGFGSGTGTVSNPRSLAVSVTFRAGTPLAFAVTFVGRIDDTLDGRGREP